MSAFTNFLSGTTSGTLEGTPILRDYQHASKLYINSNYSKIPKFGFIYFVQLNINSSAVLDKQWLEQKDSRDVGFLAKKVDLPKFQISTETVNQYNRKTVVQTKLSYNPIGIDFHDDHSDITHKLWVNYFKHYYIDSNYGDMGASIVSKGSVPESFRDTKYGTIDYNYGRYHNHLAENESNFFSSIDIYVLHQGSFTQYTLVNPKITEWMHDDVDQSDSTKTLRNRMQVAFETVIYNSGKIEPGRNPQDWIPVYYDNNPSPNGNAKDPFPDPRATYYRSQSVVSGGNTTVINSDGTVSTQSKTPTASSNVQNAIKDAVTILAKNYVNKKGLGRTKGFGYNIAGGVLGALGSGSPGKYADPPNTQNTPGILNLPGGVGINIFKGINTTVDGKIQANPAAIIFPKK